MASDPDRVQTPKTLKDFGYALGRYTPMRLGQLRSIGKIIRERAAAKPKK